MPDDVDPNAETSAEKAYAAAAEAIPVKADVELTAPAVEAVDAPPPPLPVEFPARAKRARKAAAPAVKPAKADAVAQTAAAPRPRKAVKKAAAPRPKAVKPAVAPRKKPMPAQPVLKAAKPRVPAAAKIAAAPKPQAPKAKETVMDKSHEFVEGVQKVAAETQAKARQAFEKGTALFGEYAEFAKGNVEALVESGKILASGVQGMGSDMLADGKTAIETMTSDVKQLAAVRSPGDFLKLQTDMLRRNFDSAVKLGSKNGEAIMKLASDSFVPISGRFSLAVEKLKKAA